MIFNISGGGGTTLNFRVVGGTVAPTNPAENTIWVNTDTPITSWIFSATEPGPAEAGMVWFPVGTSSPVAFNALKKNGIQVCPISANQYVNGFWVEKNAKIYQGGEWADFIFYLLKDGITQGIGFVAIGNTATPSISFGTPGQMTATIGAWSSGNSTGYIFSDESVDVTHYSKMTVRLKLSSSISADTNSTIGVSNTKDWATRIASQVLSHTTSEQTVTLDLSNVTGKVYFFCLMKGHDTNQGNTYAFYDISFK